jgi:hypothetical protein
MRTVHFRSVAIAATALLTLVGSVAAQETSTAVLTSVEVRQLVARGEPSDHIRLRAHFLALADQYEAEANRHAAMSQGFGGNPSRNLGAGMSAHCKRLVDLNTQSATTVRELATYSEKLGRGEAPTAPSGGAGFHAGAGATRPSEAELVSLAAKASTPSDHRILSEYFTELAKRYRTDAEEQAATAVFMRGPTRAPAAANVAAYYDRLSKQSTAAAIEAAGAAAMHHEHARAVR